MWLRHTYATALAGSDVSVYTQMKLLGHESITASQGYATEGFDRPDRSCFHLPTSNVPLLQYIKGRWF